MLQLSFKIQQLFNPAISMWMVALIVKACFEPWLVVNWQLVLIRMDFVHTHLSIKRTGQNMFCFFHSSNFKIYATSVVNSLFYTNE